MRVQDVMSVPVATIDAGAEASAAWERMRRRRLRHLVVTGSDGRVRGVITAADLGGRSGELLRNGRQVADLMTEKLVVATPTTTVREAANLMRGHGVNCLPVFKSGKLAGIVTALDLLELIGRGAERPVARTTRWVMKDRGPKHGRRTKAAEPASR
jgi:acetoin utilization protein AcuB